MRVNDRPHRTHSSHPSRSRWSGGLGLGLLAGLVVLLGACGQSEEGVAGKSSTGSSSAAAPAGTGLRIGEPGEHRPYYHDFGVLNWGDRAQHTFLLTNESDKTITLLDNQGACACTKVKRLYYVDDSGEEVRGQPRAKNGMLSLPPGAVCHYVVEVDSAKIGQANLDKLEVMRLRTDATDKSRYLTFELHLVGKRLFQATPRQLNFNEIAETYGGTRQSVIIRGMRGSPVELVGIESEGKFCQASMELTHPIDEPVWIVTVTIPPFQKKGALLDKIVLRTTDSEGQGDRGRLELSVIAQIVDDVVIYPRQATLGTFTRGTSKEAIFRLKSLVPGLNLGVSRASVQDQNGKELPIEVEVTPLAPDARGLSAQWSVIVKSDGVGLPDGILRGVLLVELQDEQYPEVRAQLLGNIR